MKILINKNLFTLSAVTLFVIYSILDWGTFLNQGSINSQSFLFKYLTTLLMVLYVWSARTSILGRGDSRLLKIIFGFILVADTILVVLQGLKLFPGVPLFQLGLGVFVIVQILLTIRVARLWGWSFLKSPRWILIFLGAVSLSSMVFLLLQESLARQGLLVPILVYMTVITLSLAFGLSALVMGGRIPENNALLMALGITFFYLCDASIGFTLIQEAGSPAQVVFEALIWFFYGPSLYCLARSAEGTPSQLEQDRDPTRSPGEACRQCR